MQSWHLLARRVAAALYSLLLLLMPATGLAQAYGQYDIRQLLTPSSTNGKGGSLRLDYLDRMLQDLGQHAANYPARFDSAADQQRAQRDAAALMGMFDAAFGNAAPPGLLLRMGLLGSYGHNLQLPGAATFAQTHFTRLLALQGDDPWANYHYGRFLAGSARPEQALPYLTRARDRGIVPASYALGLTYLSLGDQTQAIALLAEYQKAQPGDRHVGPLLQAIRDGKVSVKKSAEK